MIKIEASAFTFSYEVPVRLLVGDVEGGTGTITVVSERGEPDWKTPLTALLRAWADDIEHDDPDGEEVDDAPA